MQELIKITSEKTGLKELTSFRQWIESLKGKRENTKEIEQILEKALISAYNLEDIKKEVAKKPLSKLLDAWKDELLDLLKLLDIKTLLDKSIESETEKIGKYKAKVNNLPIITKAITSIVSIFVVSVGFLGTIAGSFLTYTFFSNKSFNAIVDLVKKLELLKNKFPGILTSKQKRVLAQFKKLAGDMTIKGILKNFRLRATLSSIVNELMQQDQLLAKSLGGQKKARKILERYFSKQLRLTLFKRGFEKNDNKLKALGIKAVYAATKKATENLTRRYHQLKNIDKRYIQKYIQEADTVIKEFNDLLVEAVMEDKINLKAPVKPIIPL